MIGGFNHRVDKNNEDKISKLNPKILNYYMLSFWVNWFKIDFFSRI